MWFFLLKLYLQCGPLPDGPVVRLTTPDGVECVVSRRWNGWDSLSEPYTLTFYSRVGQGAWKAQYVDHEALRYPTPRMRYDELTGRIEIRRSGQPLLRLDPREGRGHASFGPLPRELEPSR